MANEDLLQDIKETMWLTVGNVLPNHNVEDFYENENVYYMNGNDGTEFDWECNDRLCEFYIFWNNGNGALKAMLDKKGSLEMYYYETPETWIGGEPIVKKEFCTEDDVWELKDWLVKNRDEQGIWDKVI